MNIQFEQYFTQGLIELNLETVLPQTQEKKKDKYIILCKTIKDYAHPPTSETNPVCIICLDQLSKHARVCRTFCCNVEMHEKCLEELIKKEYTKTCIVCNRSLPSIKILKS